MTNKKPLEIDGIFGSAIRDTQGEILSIEGADISELEAGRGRFNDNHSKGYLNTLGRVTYAKKIFKAEDCEDDRQRYYWDKIKTPYIYGKGYLYNDEDHYNAKACAAILRNINKTDSPLKLRLSVEGGVVARGISDPSILARTKITSCAITFTPANNATLVEPLNLDKSHPDEVADMALIKSVMHLAETNVPSFRHIQRDASATKIIENMERIRELSDGAVSLAGFTKHSVIEYALESKVRENLVKIHSLMQSASKEPLDKGLKEAALGAAMMAGSIASAATPEAHQRAYREIATKNPLLGAIGMVESSGGQNYKHKKQSKKSALHPGHQAGGMFGMMPSSAEYTLRTDPKLAAKYPHLLDASKDLKNKHHLITQALNSDPKVAVEFAESLLGRNKGKTLTPEMLVSSWNHGLKGTWNKYKKGGHKAVESSPYVQKVMEEYQKIAKTPEKVSKALMAGYGGAGAPTGRTGGAVMQTEAMADGRGFRYVTCDQCGDEQIHARHQVKCRKCGTSFSLQKLEKLFTK